MDRDKVKALRKALEAAVQGVEKEHGVKVLFGPARFSENNCDFKVSVSDLDQGGQAITKEATTLRKMGELYGLPKDAVGRVIRYSGREFRIMGLNTKAPRFPVVATCVTSGKSYKLPLEDVQRALGVPIPSVLPGLSEIYDRHRGESLGY